MQLATYCQQGDNFALLLGRSDITALGLKECSYCPPDVCSQAQLQRLGCLACSFAQLPAELGQLVQLQQISLVDCSRLTSLPEQLGRLTALTDLNCEGCSSLASLPTSIGQLQQLQVLNLGNCSSLASLPEQLGHLAALGYLNCEGAAAPEEAAAR